MPLRHFAETERNERKLQNTVITTFGRDFAATNTETVKVGESGVSRQSQTWIRTPLGWRIAAAHVSDQPVSAAKDGRQTPAERL